MIDFLITENGDIAFEENNKTRNKLNITFYCTKTNALKINFMTEKILDKKINNNSLIINFNIEKKKNNKNIMLIKDGSYISQQIYMRLMTSLGELPLRQNIGSELETVRHQNMDNTNIQEKIKSVISNALNGLIDNYGIKVMPKIIKTNDDYKQVMKVIIYQNDNILFTYEME